MKHHAQAIANKRLNRVKPVGRGLGLGGGLGVPYRSQTAYSEPTAGGGVTVPLPGQGADVEALSRGAVGGRVAGRRVGAPSLAVGIGRGTEVSSLTAD